MQSALIATETTENQHLGLLDASSVMTVFNGFLKKDFRRKQKDALTALEKTTESVRLIP